MAQGRRISGIFIPVQLDTSNVDRDMEALSGKIARGIDKVQKSFEGTLNSYKLAQGIVQANKAMGELRDSAEALGKLGGLKNTSTFFTGMFSSLKQLSESFGGTVTQQREMLALMTQTQAINTQVSALHNLQKILGLTKQATIDFVQARGKVISQGAVDKFLGVEPKKLNDISNALSRTSQEYRNLARAAGEAPSGTAFQKFLGDKRIQEAIAAFKQLHPQQKITRDNFLQIAQAAGVSTQRVAEYVRQMDRASNSRRGWAGVFTPTNISAGIQSGAAALGVVGGMYGVAELTKSMYQASLKMENIQLAFQSIFGSADEAAVKLTYVRKVADQLGLSFLDAAEGAKKMYAASKGTVVEKNTDEIFMAFSKMGAALKLTGTEMDSVFLALSQMISKGKVSAEELRLQLAERMPGAVNLFAKAIGKTTAELDDMLQKGQVGLDHLIKFAQEVDKTYSEGAMNASTGLQAELNRVSSVWFDFKKSFVDTGASAEGIRVVREALEGVTKAVPGIIEATKYLLKFGVAIAGVLAIIKGYSKAKELYNIAKGAKSAAEAFTALNTAIIGLNKHLMIISGIAVAATVIYEMVTALDKGQEAIRDTTFSLDEYIEKMREAGKVSSSGGIGSELNAVLDETNKKLDNAWQKFNRIVTSSYEDQEFSLSSGVLTTFSHGFFKDIESLKTGKAEHDKVLSIAKQLGDDFMSAFIKASESGSVEELERVVQTFAVKFKDNQLDFESVASKEDNERLKKFKEGLLGAANAVVVLENRARDLSKTTREALSSGIDLTKFKSSIKALTEYTKGVKLFEKEDIKEEISSLLDDFKTVYDGMVAVRKAQENGVEGAANLAEEFSKNERLLQKFGAKALESGENIDTLVNIIKEKFPEATALVEAFKKAMEGAASINLSRSINTFVEGINQSSALMGKNSFVSGAVKVLKETYTGDIKDLVSLVEKGSFTKIPGISEEDAKALSDAYKNFTSAEAAKSARSMSASYNKVENTIRSLTSALESWRAKTKEDKEAPIGIQLEKYLAQIDKAEAAKGVTAAQIEQLQMLRSELKGAAEDYAAYIHAQQEEKAVSFYSDIAKEYGALTGDRAEIVRKAEEAEYQKRLEDARTFYENGVLDLTEFHDIQVQLEELKNAKIREASDGMIDHMSDSIDKYFAKYRSIATGIGDLTTTVMDGASRAIANFVMSGAQDLNNFGKAFEDLANTIYATVVNLFANQFVSSLLKGAMGFFNFGSSGAENAAAAQYGAGEALMRQSFPSAMGNVFSGGNLSAYSGTVVSQPTHFSFGSHIQKFARGAGLMGEAGPEAVMPLIRTPSGHLGVRSEGSNTPNVQQNVNINIIDNAGVSVTQEERRDNQGNVDIDIMLDKQISKSMSRMGSATNRTLRNVYGAVPALASR